MRIRLLLVILLTWNIFSGLAQPISFTVPGYDYLPITEDGHWKALAADFNEDGQPDLYVTREAQRDLLFYGNLDGTFQEADIGNAPWNNPLGSMGLLYADLNADGLEELIITRSPFTGGNAEAPGAKDKILKNLGLGNFVDASDNLPADFYNVLIPDIDAVNYSTGVAVGDFNQDSLPDLIMVNGGISYLPTLKLFNSLDGLVILLPALARDKLLNDLYLSTGTDVNADGLTEYAIGSNSPLTNYRSLSTDVVSADFNLDGLDDIFITNFHDASIFYVMGLNDSAGYSMLAIQDTTAAGNFVWSDGFPLTKYPASSVDAADFDEDGDVDLLIGMERRGDSLYHPIFLPNGLPYSYQMTSKLFLNDGQGHFSDATTQFFPPFKPHYTSCFDIRFIDINADGALDVFGAGIHNFLFIQNPITHTFGDSTHLLPTLPASQIPHTFHSYGAAFEDFNDDGKMDVFLANTYEQPRIQLQLPDGTFRDTTTTNLPPDGENSEMVVIADFDNDGWPDIAKVNSGNRNTHALYLFNSNLGGFPFYKDKGNQIPLDDAFTHNYGIDQADLDGNNTSDLMISGASGLVIFENDGAGNFNLNTSWLAGINDLDHSTRARFVDINGDTYPDIFVPRAENLIIGQPNKVLLWNPVQGKFEDQSAALLPPNAMTSFQFDAQDLNGDNWLDFVVANQEGSTFYLSNAGGLYSITQPFDLAQARAIKFLQLGGDSLWDVIEVNKIRTEGARLYLNDASNSPFDGPPTSLSQSEGEIHDIGIIDLNQDGLTDLILPQFHQATRAFINQGDQTFADESTLYFPNGLHEVNSVKAIQIQDVNKDGVTDLYFARDNQDLLLYGLGPVSAPPSHPISAIGNLNLFPNPATDFIQLTIEQPFQPPFVVQAFSGTGSLCKTWSRESPRSTISIADLPSGSYTLKVIGRNGVLVGKFIKA